MPVANQAIGNASPERSERPVRPCRGHRRQVDVLRGANIEQCRGRISLRDHEFDALPLLFQQLRLVLDIGASHVPLVVQKLLVQTKVAVARRRRQKARERWVRREPESVLREGSAPAARLSPGRLRLAVSHLKGPR